MSDEIFFSNKKYVSASYAALTCGLHRDYISRLAREGRILSKRIGRNWYIDESSLKNFVVKQAYTREIRKKTLSDERTRQYLQAEAFERWPYLVSQSTLESGAEEKPSAENPIEVLSDKVTETLQEHVEPASRTVNTFLQAPSGLTHAAIQGTHAVHYISPAWELIHKLIAFSVALSISLGTYALLDRHFARVVRESIHDSISSAFSGADKFAAITHVNMSDFSNGADGLQQLASAFFALDPASHSDTERGAVYVLVVPF